MKPSRPPIHILTVPEPLTDYRLLSMRCGIILEDALMVYGMNTDFRADVCLPDAGKKCEICRAHAQEPPANQVIRMWQYGLVDKRLWIAYLESRGKELEEGLVGEVA